MWRVAVVLIALGLATAANAQAGDCQRHAALLKSMSAGADPSDEDVAWAADFEAGLKRRGASCDPAGVQRTAASTSAPAMAPSAAARPVASSGGIVDLANRRPPDRATLSPAVRAMLPTLPAVANWQQPHPRFTEGEAANARGDLAGAAAAYRDAAQAGDARGHYRYGSALVAGRGVARDQARGVAFIRVASEVGVGGAGYEMYLAHKQRIAGMDGNQAAMVAYVQQSAAAHDPAGDYILGRLFADATAGVPRDVPRGLALMRSAADRGWVDAQYDLGTYAEDGVGQPKNEAVALTWYIKAGNAGHPGAQYAVGAAYQFGLGTARNGREAIRWYRAAAENGEVEAQYSMGTAYLSAIDPGLFDVAQARHWFGLAKAQGHGGAAAQLVRMAEVDRRYAERDAAAQAQASRIPEPSANDRFFANQRRVQAENCAAAAQGRMRQCNY